MPSNYIISNLIETAKRADMGSRHAASVLCGHTTLATATNYALPAGQLVDMAYQVRRADRARTTLHQQQLTSRQRQHPRMRHARHSTCDHGRRIGEDLLYGEGGIGARKLYQQRWGTFTEIGERRCEKGVTIKA